MQEKIISAVSPSVQNLCRTGCAALDRGDFNNAIVILNQVLDAEPGFVECREVLRKAQSLRAQKNNGFLKHAVEEVREIPKLLEAETYSRSQPLKAIRTAEQVLNHIPDNVPAHKILARAALKADMPRTALLSLDFIYHRVPERLAITLELIDALARAGRIREASSVCGRLQKDYPNEKRVLHTLGQLCKMASDAHTDEVARAAAARYFSQLRATSSSVVENLGPHQDRSKFKLPRMAVLEKRL